MSTFPILRGGVSLRLRPPTPGPIPGEGFFSLRENPFSLTPNPRFLHRTRQAHETLGRLTRGILDRRGLIVLCGEIGTGKTTLLYTALHLMNVSPAVQHKIATAVIVHPTLTRDEFLEAVLDEFDVPCPSSRRERRLRALLKMLLDARRKGDVAVLVIDEAQMISAEVLEEVRELLGWQAFGEKLLQIVLCGQPELQAKLDGMTSRRGEPVVAVRCSTEPLSLKDTHDYVQHRLRIAGARSDDLFTPDAVDAIHRHTSGTPRLINLLCAQALSVASAHQAARVFPYMIDEAAAEICAGALLGRPPETASRARAVPAQSIPVSANQAPGQVLAAKTAGALSRPPAFSGLDSPAPARFLRTVPEAASFTPGNLPPVGRLEAGEPARNGSASAAPSARRKQRALRHQAKFAQSAKLAQRRARRIEKVKFTPNTTQLPAAFVPSEFRPSPFRRGKRRPVKPRAARRRSLSATVASLLAWNRSLNRWCSGHFTSKSCGRALFRLALAGTLLLALAQAVGAGFPQSHVAFGFLGVLLIDIALGLGAYLLLIERRRGPADRARWAQTLLDSWCTLRRRLG